MEILESNIQIDHIHIVLSIPPKHSVSDVVGFLKGKGVIKILDRHLVGLKDIARATLVSMKGRSEYMSDGRLIKIDA